MSRVIFVPYRTLAEYEARRETYLEHLAALSEDETPQAENARRALRVGLKAVEGLIARAKEAQ